MLANRWLARAAHGWRILAVVAVAAAIANVATAQAPKMYYGHLVSAKDEKDAKGLALAKTAEKAALKGGTAPAYPNPKPPRLTPEMVAALASLPQVGPADGLLVAALSTPISKPDPDAAPYGYEWAKITPRLTAILELDTKDAAAAAIKREAAGEVLIVKDYDFVLTSRTGKDKDATPEFYILVRQPKADEIVSETEFKDIRTNGDAYFVRLTDAGKKRMASMTRGAKAETNRFVALVAESKLLYVAQLAREINDGLIVLSPEAEFELRELRDIATTIRRLIQTP